MNTHIITHTCNVMDAALHEEGILPWQSLNVVLQGEPLPLRRWRKRRTSWYLLFCLGVFTIELAVLWVDSSSIKM